MLNFDWLRGISSLSARLLIIGAFVLPLIFIIKMPKKYVFQGASDRKKWRDLKVWVAILVLIQIIVYSYF